MSGFQYRSVNMNLNHNSVMVWSDSHAFNLQGCTRGGAVGPVQQRPGEDLAAQAEDAKDTWRVLGSEDFFQSSLQYSSAARSMYIP